MGKNRWSLRFSTAPWKKVLLADTLIRDRTIVPLIESAERMGARIVVLSTEFEPGERLDALGGIAALLRYKVS